MQSNRSARAWCCVPLLLGISIAFASCGGKRGSMRDEFVEPEDYTAETSTVRLRFGWPAVGTARVEERVLRDGMRSTMRYLVKWARPPGDEDYRVRLEGLQVIEINGERLNTPEERAMVADAEAMAAAMPTLLVGSDGRLKQLLDPEAMDRAMMSHAPSTPDLRPTSVSPRLREQMRRKVMGFWSAWVGAWSGLSVPTQGSTDVPVETLIGERTVTTPMKLKVRSGDHGRLLLEGTTFVEGEEPLPVNEDLVQQTSTAAQPRRFVRRTTVVAVETDPFSLMPTRVKTHTTTDVYVGTQHRRFDEVHGYFFDWMR